MIFFFWCDIATADLNITLLVSKPVSEYEQLVMYHIWKPISHTLSTLKISCVPISVTENIMNYFPKIEIEIIWIDDEISESWWTKFVGRLLAGKLVIVAKLWL